MWNLYLKKKERKRKEGRKKERKKGHEYKRGNEGGEPTRGARWEEERENVAGENMIKIHCMYV
jgi:hypothetical protein